MKSGNSSDEAVPELASEVEASKRVLDVKSSQKKATSVASGVTNPAPSSSSSNRFMPSRSFLFTKHLVFIVFVIVFGIIGHRLLWPSHAEETSSGTNIDTSSKTAVNDAYWSLWNPAMTTSAGWTGSVKPCDAGTMMATARNSEVDAINFVRRLQRLKPISARDSAANNAAMKASLIVEANGAPNHSPPATGPGSTCYSSEGAAVSAQSNLGIDYVVSTPDSTPVGVLVKGYLDERIPPAENKTLGHRRRLSYPDANVFGIGTTAHASAIRVIGLSTSAANPSPDVMWPTGGYFPKQLAPHTWSLTGSRTTADFSAATLKVTHNGNVIKGIDKYVTDPRYGPLPTLAWSMPFQYDKSGGYIVTVGNIKGDGATRISYKVRFFDPVQ